MEIPLFEILSQLKGAEIAFNILPFLRKNQPTVSLPSDQDIVDEIMNTTCIKELLATDGSPCNFTANKINKLAIECVIAYFEITLNDQINREQLVDMINYRDEFNHIDSSKSSFTITFLDKVYVNPTEKDLFELEEALEQYGINVLDNTDEFIV